MHSNACHLWNETGGEKTWALVDFLTPLTTPKTAEELGVRDAI
jgi:hypothetical protein